MLTRAALLACLLVGCARRPPPQTPVTARPPSPSLDVAQLARREATSLRRQHVVAADGFVRVEVEAAGTPRLVPSDKTYLLEVPLGSKWPLSCHIYTKRIDPASSLRNTLRSLTRRAAARSATAFDVGHVGGIPYMLAGLTYRVDHGPQRLVGQLKVGVISLPDHGVVCAHDEVGYWKTFERLLLGMAPRFAFSLGGPLSRAPLREVFLAYVDRKAIGFAESYEYASANGRASQHYFSMLLGPTELHSVEHIQVTEEDSSGALLSKVYVTVRDGKLVQNLRLQRRGAETRYNVTGHTDGKPAVGDLATIDPLLGEQARHLRLYRLKVGAQMRFPVWLGSRPLQATEATYDVLRRDPEGLLLKMRYAAIEQLLGVESTGRSVTSSMRVGARQVITQRVHPRRSLMRLGE